MKIRSISILLFIFIDSVLAQNVNLNLSSHPPSETTETNILSDDFNSAINDLSRIGSSPLNFTGGDWIKLGIIAGATGLLMTQDKNLHTLAAKTKSQNMNTILEAGQFYGSINSAILFPSGFYLGGLLSGNKEIRTTGRILFESLLISGLTVQIIKIVSGRARPYNDKGPYYYNSFNLDNDYNSFPSGHTVIAFTISSVLAARIKNTYASIGLYTLASFTAFQRIYSENHWFSDTFLAAAIGAIVGNSLVSLNDTTKPGNDDKVKISLAPNFSQQHGIGFSIGLRF